MGNREKLAFGGFRGSLRILENHFSPRIYSRSIVFSPRITDFPLLEEEVLDSDEEEIAELDQMLLNLNSIGVKLKML